MSAFELQFGHEPNPVAAQTAGVQLGHFSEPEPGSEPVTGSPLHHGPLRGLGSETDFHSLWFVMSFVVLGSLLWCGTHLWIVPVLGLQV